MTVSSFKSYRFPETLGTDEVPNYVRFVPKTVQYGGTEDLLKGTNGISAPSNNPQYTRGLSLGGIAGSLTSGIGGLAQTAAGVTNAVGDAVNTLTSQPLSIKSVFGAAGQLVGRFADITGTTLDFGLKTLPDQLKTAGSINLYLPQNLETNSSVDYETAALGGIGTQAARSAKSDASDTALLESLGNLGKGAIQDILGSGNRRAIIGVVTNRVTNNFSFQVFNSVLHRQFSYEFRLMPKNSNESKVIKEICDHFLYYMLPSRSNQGEVGFYEVPCQWEIKYMRKGGPLNFHMQPKNCFLQSVDVSYGGDAQNATFNDGAPMEVNLRLQFIEIEPLYREGKTNNKAGSSSNLKIAGSTYDEAGLLGGDGVSPSITNPTGPGGNGGV